MAQNNQEVSMESLIKSQMALFEQMTKFIANTKKTSIAKRTHGFYVTRVNGLHDLWQKILANEHAISVIQTSADISNDYFVTDKFSTQEALYYEFKGELVDTIEKLEKAEKAQNPAEQVNHGNSSESNQAVQSNISHLPRISLPKFSGEYNEWISFRDLYLSVIHQNPNLEEVQKFHYLKTSLTGEAMNLIRHIGMTNANYAAAWKTLRDRFDNKRVLVATLLKTLTQQQKLVNDSATSIKSLLDTTNECLVSLNNLEINILHWDPIIVYLVTQRLPYESHKAWEESIGDTTSVPTWDLLKKFLESRFRTLEAISTSKPRLQQTKSETKNHVQTYYSTNLFCEPCKNGTKHSLRSCGKFLKSAGQERLKLAKSKGACLNCLGQYHSVNKCLSSSKCKSCGGKHHSLLHEAMTKRSPKVSDVNKPLQSASSLTYVNKQHELNEKPVVSNIATHFIKRNKQVLLATAVVNIKTVEGIQKARALIDPGSQASFITNSAMRRMKLRFSRALVNVTGLANSSSTTSNRIADLTISGPGAASDITVNAIVLETLTDLLPSKRVQIEQWEHIQGLTLADPNFHTPGRIDLLIGADIYPMILLNGVKFGLPGTPLAQNTIFGWILSGEICESSTFPPRIVSLINIIEPNFDLKRFWEIEEIPAHNQQLPEDLRCEEFFQNTHFRKEDGSYVVRLPFKEERNCNISLGASRDIAMKRYLSLEKSLKSKNALQEYHNVLQDYIQSGHMVETSNEQASNISVKFEKINNYLPHHGVFKQNSTTTKLRVVFDASCKTTSGASLNDVLLTGPSLQQDITAIIMKWRFHRYVFTADIEKMYRQIWLHPADTDYQRILWRPQTDDIIRDYKLLTVTFGVSCAPYLAIRTLNQLAEDEKAQFPLASNCILSDFYVDDVLTGSDSIAETNKLKEELITLLKQGGFHLRKFSANHPAILQDLNREDVSPEALIHLEGKNTIKTLGIIWDPTEDIFQYKVNVKMDGPPTKRNILSKIAKLYDPLGWLSPIIIYGKILIQKLWLAGLDWDCPIPNNLETEWSNFIRDLKNIESLKIPRWLQFVSSTFTEFHGFCDSSERAYAAVIYSRVRNMDGNITTNLIISKTKVSPVKTVTLPRLELCGAHLLAKLVNHLQQNLGFQYKFHLWTDSMITLSWVKSHPNRWKSFVANRVADIHQHAPEAIWRHVPSEDNPADLASRGVFASELINQAKWWKGPSWLTEDESKWPKTNIPEAEESLKERKRVNNYHVSTNKNQFIEKYSNYLRACRVLAYCHRFIDNIKRTQPTSALSTESIRAETTIVIKNHQVIVPSLSTAEINKAKNIIIKQCQEHTYFNEIKDLQAGRPLSKKSHIISLNPFLDADGILRVGGRLEHANITFAEKHPIILPRQAHLTSLIIDYIHLNTCHGGPNLILSQLRKNYWIPGVKVTIKKRFHMCMTCYRWKKSSPTQIMGNLPQDRTTFVRPFYAVGIDYAGPINIKLNKTRTAKTAKAYIAIFVCFATKAIHIEVVSDLSSEAFLAALRRFFSRRGLCKEIYSDNGTNFVGAEKILKKEMQHALRHNIKLASEQVANLNINWHFIPPGAPHFGGLWEAGVKSIKHHLRRIVGQANLTYEELNTLLTQIEAILNSRPLCPITSDPEDFNPLTPGHFLIGDVPLSLPETEWDHSKVSSLSRWQHIQKLRHDFWKRWVSEYLPRLQQRAKWQVEQPSIQSGDLVLLKEENMLPSQWKLARVLDVHPGRDNKVRVVTLRTPNNVLKRPISKICQLPLQK